jgi:dTDP-4-dehydrorhamnose 3,5-epimerase-like enzyme
MLESADWSKLPFKIQDLQLHTDQRGGLFEALRFTLQDIPGGGQIYVYSVNPGQRRGDHYHLQKGEWFFCASGSVRLLMKTKSGDIINQILDAREPKLVYAGPGTAHAVVNEADETAIIVAYGSKEFSPKEPDTFPQQVDSHDFYCK